MSSYGMVCSAGLDSVLEEQGVWNVYVDEGWVVSGGLSVPVWQFRNITLWGIPREHTWKGYQGERGRASDAHMIQVSREGWGCGGGVNVALWHGSSWMTSIPTYSALAFILSGKQNHCPLDCVLEMPSSIMWGSIRQFEPTRTTCMPLRLPKIITPLIFMHSCLWPLETLNVFLSTKQRRAYWDINQGVRYRGMLGCFSDQVLLLLELG